MDGLFIFISLVVPASLFGIFLASLPSGWRILKYGNAIDSLGREIEEENQRKESEESRTDKSA